MNSKLLSACALAALTASVATAHADTKEEREKRAKSWSVGRALGHFVSYTLEIETSGGASSAMQKIPACYELIEQARKDGMQDSDLLTASELGDVPGEAGGATRAPEAGYWQLPLSKAHLVCDRYKEAHATLAATEKLDPYFDLGLAEYGMSVEELSKLAGAADRASWDKSIASGQQCLADVDAVIAAGVPATRPIVIDRSEPITLNDFKQNICQRYIDWATKMKAEVPAFYEARQAAITAKYAKVGIKGERLELFVYYDQEWYLPGCESATGDPKKLKKAKKLFQWFDGPDGLITIRKYTFKGDNYSTSERTTYDASQAYKLCR